MSRIKLFWFSAFLVSMSSCDTRDDYFLEKGDAPIIDMTTTNDTMSSEFWEGKKYRVIEVGFGKPDTLSFSINDPYGKECTYDFQFQSLPADNQANGVFAEELLYFFGDEICTFTNKATSIDINLTNREVTLDQYSDRTIKEPALSLSKSKGKFVFSLNQEKKAQDLVHDYLKTIVNYAFNTNAMEDVVKYQYVSQTSLLHEIPFSKEVSARFALTATNKIGVSSTEYVLVKIKPNTQPIPTIQYSCIDKETNEYKFIAGGQDPDGHKIIKWSYIFDHTPFKLGSKKLSINWTSADKKTGMESAIFDGYLYYDAFESTVQYDGNDWCFYYATFGKKKEELEGVTEVDFITPTSRNEINHIFQTKGEHTISVRCQDEYGLWSDYVTEKIYIE